jgi:signal transduction histidine kinase
MLSRRATYFQATVGFLLLTAVFLAEYFGLLAHYPLNWALPAEAHRNPSLVAATLVLLGVTLYLATYLSGTIAVDLRERVRANVFLSRQIADDKRQIEVAYEALRQVERTKSEYMRKVAHELRGPLGVVETALKVVLQGMAGQVSEQSRDLIGRAQRRAGELAAIAQDLLTLARAREAGLIQERTPVAIEELAADVIDDLRSIADRKGVILSTAASAGGTILADPVAIRQLISNLVENGIRYTGRGGVVSVRLSAHGGGWMLEVQDTGIGIAEEDQPRIFEEFYRATNARGHAADGTGLGLAIVRAIVERQGGDVAVTSKLGQGTRFTVTLPGAPGTLKDG